MNSMRKSVFSAVAGAGALAVALAGCSGGSDSQDAPSGEAIAQEYDLSGIDVAVGSKDFDEQLILGQMMVQAFEAAGANVEDKVDLGGTEIARAALESGQIDVYMEYNGTGWTVHLGQEDPSFDSEELTANVREKDLEENQIVWVGLSPFNNTYGFATGPDVTEANGGAFTLQTMMEYVRDNPDAVVCMESEFPTRPDGLILTEEATGIELPDNQQRILDTGVIYTETAAGNCTFGEVFTTDGRIAALDLTVVEDPGVNILYNVSATFRQETYDQAPEAFDGITNAILEPLNNEEMAKLNARVSAEGEDPAQVAKEYLQEQGIIN
ncbi:MAG: glycine betaine ABC transporter substrate-binding protein [Actinobacteria bacterium]|nr:glycine betaine ABC transporter substrate-binding protein [Actinomycetota bacterium]MCB9413463.1 glycine betaine ABC transporter substrate-binding protein [Actinomycetota bacterium]